jgi:hypothetical protein
MVTIPLQIMSLDSLSPTESELRRSTILKTETKADLLANRVDKPAKLSAYSHVRPMRILAFAAALSLVSTAVADSVHNYSCYSYIDGKTFESQVSPEEIARTPAWLPEAENPPLSARRAIQTSRQQMEAIVADRSVWRLDSVQLLDMGDHLHWMYLVEFERQYPEDVAVYGDHSLRILVLMDGTVITPKLKEAKH